MVLDAADHESPHAVLAGYSAQVRPEPLLERVLDEGASLFRDEYRMNKTTGERMRS